MIINIVFYRIKNDDYIVDSIEYDEAKDKYKINYKERGK